jgi:hypothetical protein
MADSSWASVNFIPSLFRNHLLLLHLWLYVAFRLKSNHQATIKQLETSRKSFTVSTLKKNPEYFYTPTASLRLVHQQTSKQIDYAQNGTYFLALVPTDSSTSLILPASTVSFRISDALALFFTSMPKRSRTEVLLALSRWTYRKQAWR